MTIYKLKGEAITPIHIGDGSELTPFEYVIKEDRFYKINQFKFTAALTKEALTKFDSITDKGIQAVRSFILGNVDPQTQAEYSLEVTTYVQDCYEKKFDSLKNQLIVNPFIRSGTHPFIPGSSLKGAIRTALIYNWMEKGTTERDANILEGRVLGCLKTGRNNKKVRDHGKDPFRAVKVVDSFLCEDATFISRVGMLHKEKSDIEPIGISLFKEITNSLLTEGNADFETEIRIDEKLFNKKAITIEDIIKSCNTFASDIIEYELNNYFKNDSEMAKIYEDIKEYMHNGFLLRLGWGSGFHSVTVNLNTARPKEIKTRKEVEGIVPMGWIGLKPV